MLKIGMMQDFRNPQQWRRPNAELYAAILDQIVRAEELGYDNVWLTEHHFAEDGYNPSLMPTAAAIATRTHRIRIGTPGAVGSHHGGVRRHGVAHERDHQAEIAIGGIGWHPLVLHN